MHTRDRIRLDADVYYPDCQGDLPVLLMRQPYGRAIASTVVYAHPAWYAAHGYIVVIQDVRGRGTSEGEFRLFENEINDGYDAVCWAASLPQSNGKVGMYGFSYQGMTQLYAAAAHPPALKVICPSMAAYDLYHDWAYEGGAFCYWLNLAWALQLAAETARRQANEAAYQTLYGAAHNPPVQDPVSVASGLLQQLAPDSFYHDWLAHPDPDEYWLARSPKSFLDQVDLPMLHIGGWFDPYLRGTLNLYQAMVAPASAARSPQSLIVGPWSHLPWSHRVGSLDYGQAANSPIDRWQLRWFDHFLKGIDTGLLDQPSVHWFEMGSNQWRDFDRFPCPHATPSFIHTDGLAALDDSRGRLSAHPPTRSCPSDILVHDPWRPVPAAGGHASFPSGAWDRAAIDGRTDVLTYTTEPLQQVLHLVGAITVVLHCSADVPSFDLCVVLSEGKPHGSFYNFSQGYRRVSRVVEAQSLQVAIELQPTCICLAQGSRLRLSISGACAPAYAVNPGTGAQPRESRLITAQVITLAIESQPHQPSLIHLPVDQP